ncbi:MAG: rod shape-determining protein MreD [Clostridia bacterium]|nr:rod shape-determining protein MreD [Clostridia bacterium]
MRRKRMFFLIVFTLFAVMLDASVLPHTGLNMRYVPRICLVAVALIGTVLGSTQGIIYGAMAGILLDITVYQPAGLVAVVYTLCGLIAGFISYRTRAYLVTLIPPAAVMLFYTAVMSLYVYFSTGVYPADKLGYALIQMVISMFLVQLLYLPLVKILKPTRIGRRRRA